MHSASRTLALATGLALATALAAPAGAATITVDTLVFAVLSDGHCSLPEAVQAANGNAGVDTCAAGAAGTDTIAFSVAGTIFYNHWLDEFAESAVVEGAGIVFDGDGQQRLFSVDTSLAGQKLTINGATIQNGTSNAIFVGPGETLWLQDSIVRDNAAGSGAAIYASDPERVRIVRSQLSGNEAYIGGAVYQVGGTLVIEDSTLDHNVATFANGGGQGGAVYLLQGTLDVKRSTFSANTTGGDGGALALYFNTTGSINSSTIASNVADSDGDENGGGGGLWLASGSSVSVKNTVVAANTDGSTGTIEPDFSLQPDGSSVDGTAGFNFVGSNASVSGPFPLAAQPALPNFNGNYVGSPAAPLLPLLAPLAANGGLPTTRMPLRNSPLVDHGACSGATRDQRGYGSPTTLLRAYDVATVANGLNTPDACDIGAVEYLAVP